MNSINEDGLNRTCEGGRGRTKEEKNNRIKKRYSKRATQNDLQVDFTYFHVVDMCGDDMR